MTGAVYIGTHVDGDIASEAPAATFARLASEGVERVYVDGGG